MIILYDKNKITDFDRNDLILQNVTKCEVKWEKNSLFQIDLIYAIKVGDDNWKQIVKGAIIKCPVAYQDDQLFRLNTPTKKMDDNSGNMYIEVTGYHITYDLSYNFLEDLLIKTLSGTDAGALILSNTQYPHQFVWVGDIQTTNSTEYIRQNVIDALIGSADTAYMNLWGGELKRDNFNIGMYALAGENNGVIIKYSKNLNGFEQSADDSALVTRAMPTTTIDITGADGSAVSTLLKIPERYVDSPLIKNYANIYIKEIPVVLTDEQKLLSLAGIYDIMRAAVVAQYAANIDVPIYSYSVNFIELNRTHEYEDVAILEEVKPFDMITIRALDIDVTAELVAYSYDAIGKMYEEVTLGNIRNDILRHNQKSLFDLNTINQQNIKVLQQQFTTIPDAIAEGNTITGGNNLFDHAILTPASVPEWTAVGAAVVTDPTLHDTDQVWNLPPAATITKDQIVMNPDNYRNTDFIFSLQAKYEGLTAGDGIDTQITPVLLGALNMTILKCIAESVPGSWTPNDAATGIITQNMIVTAGAALNVTNPNKYNYVMHGYDPTGVFVSDFTGSAPAGVDTIITEILDATITPETISGFTIYETAPTVLENIAEIYASGIESVWATHETAFSTDTGNNSDIIQDISFHAANNDVGTVSIAGFMINTGTVRSDFSQSNNDTVQILAIHQLAIDNATNLINAGKNGYVVINSDPDTHIQFEILIMDTPDIATAQSIWRWDSGGFGYSSTGYAGPYETAITMDGHIVAKFLSGLEVDGSLIKTGTIQSYNGNWKFNLDDENFNLGNALSYADGVLTFGSGLVLKWENLSTTTQNNLKGETGDTGAAGADGMSSYEIQIISTNGNRFKYQTIFTTVLYAYVYQGGVNVTDTIDSSKFSWTRSSGDTVADNTWNNNHMGYKNITITQDDVFQGTTFECDVTN